MGTDEGFRARVNSKMPFEMRRQSRRERAFGAPIIFHSIVDGRVSAE